MQILNTMLGQHNISRYLPKLVYNIEVRIDFWQLDRWMKNRRGCSAHCIISARGTRWVIVPVVHSRTNRLASCDFIWYFFTFSSLAFLLGMAQLFSSFYSKTRKNWLNITNVYQWLLRTLHKLEKMYIYWHPERNQKK